VLPFVAATVGIAVIVGVLDSEYRYIRMVGGWKSYASFRSNPLRVAAATAATVLGAVGPIPALVSLGYLDLLPGNPAGYGVLLGAGLFASVLRGFAPVPACSAPISITTAVSAAGRAGGPRTSNE
jgi:hypothetical protein